MLHITGWDTLYENAASRRYGRLNQVFLPNRFDGSKYAELITGENGIQRYAAWVTLLAVASKNGAYGQRGYLQRTDGRPHTTASLSLITRIPAAVYEDAIAALIALGWLEVTEQPGETDKKAVAKAVAEPTAEDAEAPF